MGNISLNSMLYARLRQRESASSVKKSLPVLFFGDLFTAQVVTIGLNPSHQEYVDRHGAELEGTARRFETLTSLHAESRSSLTNEQCKCAIDRMQRYFKPGKPIYSWFRPLDCVTRAMEWEYEKGEVAHLDLVQEATKPTWTKLSQTSPAEFCSLRSTDLPFFHSQLERFEKIDTVICNGRTVSDEVGRFLRVDREKEGTCGVRKWHVGRGLLHKRTIFLVGWNIPLQNAPGLRPSGLQEFGQTLKSHLCSLGA